MRAGLMTEIVKRVCRCGKEFEVRTAGPGQNRKYCSSNCRKRRWDAAIKSACIKCGKARAKNNPGLCSDCYHAALSLKGDKSIQKAADLYNQGRSWKEISAEFGWSETSNAGGYIEEARRRGLITEYRYSEARRKAIANRWIERGEQT